MDIKIKKRLSIILLMSLILNIFSPFILNFEEVSFAKQMNSVLKVKDNYKTSKDYPLYIEKPYYPVRVYKDKSGSNFFSLSFDRDNEKLKVLHYKKVNSGFEYTGKSLNLSKGQKGSLLNREFGYKDNPDKNYYYYINNSGNQNNNLAVVYDWQVIVRESGKKPFDPGYYYDNTGHGGPTGVYLPAPIKLKVKYIDKYNRTMKDNDSTELKAEEYTIYQGSTYSYENTDYNIDGYTTTITDNLTGTPTEGNSEIVIEYTYYYEPSEHKPRVDRLLEGDRLIKGEGIPGDTIKVYDKMSNLIGEVKVDQNGYFELNLDKGLEGKDELTFIPERGDDKGENLKLIVEEKPFDPEIHKPEVDQDTVKEGSKELTGKGVPGDEIVIKDKDGTELGKGTVDEDGNFKIELESPLKPGDELTLNPNTDGKEGTPLILDPVEYDKELHKPNIENAIGGEEKVTGTGIPGDNIVIKDKDGNEIGKGTVYNDGNFNINLTRPLEEGEKIKAQAVDGENKSEETEVEVTYSEANHKPELDDLKEGDEKATGRGTPGDTIVITDKDGKELGKEIVGDDGKFEVGLIRPLEKGETIKATPKTGDNEGESVEKEVEFNEDYHKPEVDEDTVKEGSKELTGKGVPGDEIVIKDKDGTELGKGKVDKDGNFKINLKRPLKPGDELTLTPKTGDKEGTPLVLDPVEYDKELHKPNIENAIGGEEKVTGTGIEGDNIVITDENGKEIGKGTVYNDGNFNITLTRPLKEGEKIKAQAVDGENKSEETEVEVTYNASNHKPTLNPAKEGDTKVTGIGIPGDEIIIKDKDGNELGRANVDDNGKFEITVAPLMVGKLTAIPVTNGNEGEEGEGEVEYNPEAHKPNIEKAKEGEKEVTGKGVPGDEIVITDKDGKELGKGTVDKDGNFKIEIDRPLKEGEEITAKAKTGDKESEEIKVTVTYEASNHKPELDDLKEGDEKLTGTGTAGDIIVITDEKGDELGTGKVVNGKFEVELNRPLEKGETIKATPKTGDNEGESVEKEVEFNEDYHKPKVDEDTVKDGSKEITGKGQPGDEIVITDKDGKELGKGKVDEDGNFKINLKRPLKPGDELTLTPNTDGKEGTPLILDPVEYDKEYHKPIIEQAVAGEEKVTGNGAPGDIIVITDEGGQKLGTEKVDENGNFNINLNRPLKEGETIKATPKTGDNEGESVEKEVEFNEDYHKPEVDEDTVKDGSKEITGKGQPGDKIVITDKDGNELGKGEVDEDGNFKVDLNRPLKPGDELSLTPNTDGKEGTPLVLDPVEYDKELHKPNIENAIGGEEKVTGTGIEGDNIVITDENGNELGTGTVYNDGNFNINLTRPLKEGEKIKAQAVDGENRSEETEVEVTYSAANHKPEVDDLQEGNEKATGTGIEGDIIVITDEKGNELGTGKVVNGKFEVDLNRPLKKGETIKATPKTGNNEGESVEKEVEFNEDYHKPEVDEDTVKEGSKEITGKGVPGDEIVITDKDGKELGKGEVDEDGNFKIDLKRPLKPGDELTLTPNTDGKEGTPVKLDPVEYDKELHKPNIEKAIGGEEKVTGKGVPGDEIIITDKDGKELGKGTVGEDGKFEVDLTRPLKEGEKIKAQAVDGDNKSKETEVQVTYNASNHKPTLNPVKEGDTKVTGIGIPGDEIIIKDKDGNELGRAKVDDNGKFEIKVAPLMVGKLTAIPVTNGNEGEEGEGEVEYNPEAHKPNIEKAKEGEKEVTGKGIPGDEIVITDKDGKELGKGTVGKDGNFKIEIDRPLKEGEEVTAKAKTGDKESEDTKVTVTYEAEKHKPKLDPVEEGDKKLTGTGTPGDEIIVKDKDGNELGRGKVDKDGKFEISLDKPLKPGTIILTPVTGNNEGEALEQEVKDKEVIIPEPEKPIDPEEPPFDKDKHKPEVEEIYDGDKIVSGKGIPGDSIIIVDQNGKEIGKTQVDKNGNFKVELTRPVKEGEVIIVRPITEGKEGTETLLTVKPKEEENVYDKLNSEDHIAYIQGFVDGTVRPNQTITREEVAAVIYRLLKPSYRETIKTNKTSFKDVSPKRWSRKHIASLENGKIVNGTGNGNFSPERKITKAEVIVMLSRLEKLDTRPNNDFTDIKGHWAEAEIKSAANKGWINGNEKGRFEPDKHLTRAEFVTIMNNVLNRRVEEKDILPEAKGFKDLKKDKWYYEAMMEAINSHHYERKDNGFEKWTEIYYPNLDM